ncbi:MAG: hypothetical protein O7G87_17860 [bacterium]|nr:hypothetical protein [bacterium]
MARARYDTVREIPLSPDELIRLSDSLQFHGQPCHLSHLIGSTPDPVRLAQVKDVIEAVVMGRKYEILVLRSQGKTYGEIGMLLEISKSAVQSHYRKAVRQVRYALGVEPVRPKPPSEKRPSVSPSI